MDNLGADNQKKLNTETVENLKKFSRHLNDSFESLTGDIDRLKRKYDTAVEKGATDQYLTTLVQQLNKLEMAQAKMSEAMSTLGTALNNKVKKMGGHVSKDQEQSFVKTMGTLSAIKDEIKEAKKALNKENRKSGSTRSQADIDELVKKIKELEDVETSIKKDFATKHGEETRFVKAAMQLFENKKYTKLTQDALEETKNEKVDRLALREAEDANAKAMEVAQKRLSFFKTAWDSVKRQIRGGYDMWNMYNAQAISDAKRLGMVNKEQAMGYMETLMEKSKDLSRNFGISVEQASKMQETFSKVTGKATLLTTEQMEDIAASSKLMGEETVQSAIQVMDNIGTTSETTMGLLDKNYARALNTGLDVTKASEAFVKNMSLANKLNFRNGVDGISKMTIMSQRIKFNLEEVANVAEKFSSIEGAIEGSARLQVLGGPYAMLGGNPMQMLFESMADPEALFKRTADMFGQQAVFNRKTGEAEIDPMQRQFIFAAAEAMGISKEEAIQTSKKQATLKAIEGDWKRSQPGVFATATEDEKAILGNLAQFDTKTQSWKITYRDDENKEQTKRLEEIDKKTLEVITKNNINVERPVEDIRKNVRDIASELVGFKERWEAMQGQYKTGVAQVINPAMQVGDEQLTKVNNGGYENIWGGITGGGWGSFLSVLGLGAASGLSAYGGYKLSKFVGDRLLKALIPGGGSSPAASGANAGFSNAANTLTKTLSSGENSNNLKFTRLVKGGASKISNPLKWGSKLSKGAKIGGAATAIAGGVIEGAVLWHMANEKYNEDIRTIENNKELRNSLTGNKRFSASELAYQQIHAENEKTTGRAGAVGSGVGVTIGSVIGGAIGSAIAPGVGTVVGGAIGGAIGGWLGKKTGKALAPEKDEGLIAKHVKEIQDSNEKENFRKIVLPIESIDYNVSLIANQLGIRSAVPARGNVFLDAEAAGEIQVEGTPIQASSVNQVDSQIINASDLYRPTGPITLHVDGAIELNMKGNNAAKITPEEFKQMVNNNPELQRFLVDVITGRQNNNVNGQRNLWENPWNRMRGISTQNQS